MQYQKISINMTLTMFTGRLGLELLDIELLIQIITFNEKYVL